MLGIGLSEIILVFFVMLIAIKPHRWSELIKAYFKWKLKAKKIHAYIYQQVKNEINIDEVKQNLHNEQIMEQLKKTDKSH